MMTAMMIAQKDSSIVAGKRTRELLKDRMGGAERIAEVAVQRPPDIFEILLPDRPVEPELVHEFGVALRADAALARHRHDRIGGKQADES